MIKNAQHVFPSSGRWAVRRTGAQRASRVFATRSDAIRHARMIARKEHAELYIHKKDGTVLSMDSYTDSSGAPNDKK